MSDISEFQRERERLTTLMTEKADMNMKRFLNLDTKVYEDGALPAKQKEMLGLVASLVLRCDDCINYHLVQCYRAGVSEAEIVETMDIGLIVGGSITIPHIRRALKAWDELGRKT
ncbi:MAG: carboxymuconolactone decarboxylase family protein [Candidatus Thermoplasmatota archaeon]|nr:carboxymuconolactone decarboxylase family protein [Euryarchaeota archaeon]MBU4032550.1 carboxymuconolactone decarboxylase family protein [Candidatus Thermoplasmatota archaeon]MBU4072023.1 carboxymuconolactone decarboxylase family protein [Candidatus Thermoplasmatota archaeon]MBU4144554.1 carboxymuconolactone decarboxylase family protein [Candidatus Thermoplasmatota archaeon]MBU4592103.1 carboxymuconolactone decarboxylase family protein [Candidatus Thermoplasmatota archaeon]